MKKLNKKQALWLCLITLFVACALSMYAMYKGSIPILGVSVVFFVIGFLALKQHMSL